MDRHDRPDDSSKNRHAPGSMREDVSGTGQRFKGAVKRETGDAFDNEEMEDKGARENQAGHDRHKRNNAV